MHRRQTRLSRPPTPLHHAQNRSKRSVTHRLPTSPFGPHRKTLRGYATREDASLGHHAGCVHGHHAGSTGPRLRLGPRPAGLLFASGPEGARRGAADVLEETHCVPRALLRRAKWSSTLSCAAQSLPRAKLTLLGLRLWPDLELLVRDTAPRSRSARARVPAQCASSACCPLSAVQRLTPFLCGAQTGSSKAAQSLASASLQQRIPGAECAVARPASGFAAFRRSPKLSKSCKPEIRLVGTVWDHFNVPKRSNEPVSISGYHGCWNPVTGRDCESKNTTLRGRTAVRYGE